MTMLPTFLAGANWVMHSAGWLESGLVSCYEKFVVDIEILRMLQEEFTPLEVDEASLAFDAHLEVGQGGHFLGAAHTLERFRDCFYRPLLSSTENFERWNRLGARDATERAGEIWRATLEEYEQPPLDEGSGPSSRPTSPAAGRSSATRNGGATMRLAGHYERLGTERAFEVLARARALEAQGRNIIHLEIGEPDFDTPPHVVEAGVRALREGHTHYCPAPGLPELRDAAAEHLTRTRGVAVDPGPRAGRTRREVVPLLRRPRGRGRRRRGDLPEPGLPDLRVGDQLVGRHGGAAPDHRGDRVRVHRRRPRGAAHAADADGHPELAGQPDGRRARPRAERRDRPHPRRSRLLDPDRRGLLGAPVRGRATTRSPRTACSTARSCSTASRRRTR